ncbi:MAG: NADH-quinone oxidoreductase subunit C [Deltaproteobacteria bacterium]|nr:NADH-quinone oxidoreductase subunit C [Deltaproteobacteria bacterium]
MSALFVVIKNAASTPTEMIPILSMEIWRSWVLETCKTGGRVLALFAIPKKDPELRLFAVLGIDVKGEIRVAATDLPTNGLRYSSLTPEIPEVHLFERELAENHGILCEGHPWLKPVRKLEGYPFYRFEGEEVHEVAVGPVHAGIIEPGHFRFQCHGEKVFNLEIQLGYQHRGVEKLMAAAKPSLCATLAESIAGDTVLGHGLAYCHAIEGLCGKSVSQRAKRLRAIALELERLANHAGDLSALAGDIGFLPANAYFGRLRGEFLNLLMEISGNRFGRSLVRPGGVLFDIAKESLANFQKRIAQAATEMKEVAELFFSTPSVLSRLEHTGSVSTGIAKDLGLVGPAARASNLLRDIRHDYPTGAYRFEYIPPMRLSSGDVYARARIRSLESKKSLEFISEQLKSLPLGKIFTPCHALNPSSFSVSLIEGWRGEIAHIVFTNEQGEITNYKIVDPSFHNWMALAMAMREGQISDFPLCNKSFNLSYAGHDL